MCVPVCMSVPGTLYVSVYVDICVECVRVQVRVSECMCMCDWAHMYM